MRRGTDEEYKHTNNGTFRNLILFRSYAERDKYAGEIDKLRDELERSQSTSGNHHSIKGLW